ncbi:MAG: YdcF family protein [Bacteroidetes bacterium]|nr:YdcF family protein [Bacteroidota bacterium]
MPEENVIAVSAENAYDTISEAKAVGKVLVQKGFKNIIITTSKFHTRRARHIWKRIYPEALKIYTVAAREDPYFPESWWKEGRQIRWVLAENGAWLYLLWKSVFGGLQESSLFS